MSDKTITLHKDQNHSHYWSENGILYESYKTIRGLRYRKVLDVPGFPTLNFISEKEINEIHDQLLTPNQNEPR